MNDIIIRNHTGQSDTMILVKIGLYLAGQQDGELNIEKRRCNEGSTIFTVTEKQEDKRDWKAAAEGLALMIEKRGNI